MIRTSASEVCWVLRDEIAIHLFLDGISMKGLSRKQFYTRLENLKAAGLVKKRKSRYELTSTGIVVKKALLLMDQAMKLRGTLNGFDVLKVDEDSFTEEQWINQLFYRKQDQEIRDILLQRAKAGLDLSAAESDDQDDDS